MRQDTTVVALAGAGDRSVAILDALLGTPGVEVRYVVDPDLHSPAAALARQHGIRCVADRDTVDADAGVDLVITTGEDAPAAAAEGEPADGRVLGVAGTRLLTTLAARLAAVEDAARVEKARYLRQASHQVKSPISAIQSYVNVILGGYTGEIPERTRDIVQKIHSRCEAALAALAKRRLLADLRCLDRDGLETAAVSVREALTEATARHAEAAGARGVQVRRPVPGEPDLVDCAPGHLTALLSELVENAIVYSSDGGAVELSVEPRPDDRLAVLVRDHGIGIPERCLPRIFDEDYRADVATKHHPDGAGLGLAIAREIAALHGFDLDVRSVEGSGTVATLTVPAA